MSKDKNKDITNIEYNHLNLPKKVQFATTNMTGKYIEYTYDATGVKLAKTVQEEGLAYKTSTYYSGAYIYEQLPGMGISIQLKFISHPEGYIEPNNQGGYDYIFHYKDHLGNIRLSYKDTNNNGSVDSSEIKEENNYYPFGLKHKGYNNVVNGTDYPYGYLACPERSRRRKEENDELGLEWLDFGARNYDASLGRWMNIDPKADKYYQLSPYQAMANNPIVFVDPDGEDIIIVITGKIVTDAVSAGRSLSAWRGNYYFYKVNIHYVESSEDWLRAQSGEMTGPLNHYRNTETTMLARDAWGNEKKYGKRSANRYGTNNETPPGIYFLNYNKDGFGESKNHILRLSDTKGGNTIKGPHGVRMFVDIHGWTPHHAIGCFTTGFRGSKEEGLGSFFDLIKPALERGEEARVVVKERHVQFNEEDDLWEGYDQMVIPHLYSVYDEYNVDVDRQEKPTTDQNSQEQERDNGRIMHPRYF